ncbi:MAG: transporter substrate-binding domain-containing protein [Rhodoferax sp.]|nr:transporter substrate-binding domain-containing protein [Rhodoferax sp.]
MQVPVSSTGFSVILGPKEVSGIYPDFLRAVAAKEDCEIVFSPMPRARQELLFATGKADLLVPASRTPRRDASGTFVPLIRSRAVVISIDQQHKPFASLQDLVNRKDVRVVLVRGFDYGTAYQQVIQTLTQQNRLVLEADATSVARLLKANPSYVTIMASTILLGVLPEDPRLAGLADQLHFEAVDDLPWGESGVYVSNTALQPKEAAQVLQMLRRHPESGSVWKSFQTYYTAAALKDNIKAYEH